MPRFTLPTPLSLVTLPEDTPTEIITKLNDWLRDNTDPPPSPPVRPGDHNPIYDRLFLEVALLGGRVFRSDDVGGMTTVTDFERTTWVPNELIEFCIFMGGDFLNLVTFYEVHDISKPIPDGLPKPDGATLWSEYFPTQPWLEHNGKFYARAVQDEAGQAVPMSVIYSATFTDNERNIRLVEFKKLIAEPPPPLPPLPDDIFTPLG